MGFSGHCPNGESLPRLLDLLSANSFAQSRIPSSPISAPEFLHGLVKAAKEAKAALEEGWPVTYRKSKGYRVADEAHMLAQLALRDLNGTQPSAYPQVQYYPDERQAADLVMELNRSFGVDSEAKTIVGEGGLIFVVSSNGSDTRAGMHPDATSGIRTQYDSGGY